MLGTNSLLTLSFEAGRGKAMSIRRFLVFRTTDGGLSSRQAQAMALGRRVRV